jgi:hypothetical protein
MKIADRELVNMVIRLVHSTTILTHYLIEKDIACLIQKDVVDVAQLTRLSGIIRRCGILKIATALLMSMEARG